MAAPLLEEIRKRSVSERLDLGEDLIPLEEVRAQEGLKTAPSNSDITLV
jgi:hypothetical protein